MESTITSPTTLVLSFAVLSVVYFIARIIHRLYIHPLHHIPGPALNAISRIPYARHMIAGTTVNNVKALHNKYGDVVRISPNEISFSTGDAWQEIYGFRTGKHKGKLNMQKDPAWYSPAPGKYSGIVPANDEDHSRFRRLLSHAFSASALANQETLLQGYVDLLINRLKEVTSEDTTKAPQDLTQWYNWTTFDIMADMLFGEPFGNLQAATTHKYIVMLFANLRGFVSSYVLYYWPITKRFRNLILDRKAMQSRVDYHDWIMSKVQRRIQLETQRPDFMTEILKHNGDEKGLAMNTEEIRNNASSIMTAGSETTASLLSAVTDLLLRNPRVLQKLQTEIRSSFPTLNSITIAAVNNSPYLIAVLQEALRYFPPAPTSFQRRIPKGGEVVTGYYLPEGTAVCVSSYPLGHSERNFRDPEAFVPERWMGDPRYAEDKRGAMQPFSFGPRNCLGMVKFGQSGDEVDSGEDDLEFDFELDGRSEDWLERCKVMVLWDKPELLVHVKEVVRD